MSDAFENPEQKEAVPATSPPAKLHHQAKIGSTPRARFAIASHDAAPAPSHADVPKTKAHAEPPKKKKVDPLKDKYRDRAEERRQSARKEGDDEEQAPLDVAALRERMERSKYLGGSEETTHLVEGLDIMLYERRKLEIELEEQKKKKAADAASQTAFLGAKQVVIDQHGRAKAVDAPQEFKTSLGRGIYNALFHRERAPSIETFLPGRTTYVFPLDSQSRQELPTIVERSMLSDLDEKAERDIRTEPILAGTSTDAFNKLAIVMSYFKKGESGIKKRKQDLQKKEERAKEVIKETLIKVAQSALPAKSAPSSSDMDVDDDDEDMFSEAPMREYAPTTAASATSGNVSRPTSTQELWDAVRSETGDGRVDGDAKGKRTHSEMEKEAEKKRQSAGNDYGDFEGFDEGSDEEDMFAKDTGVKLKRYDFATDEEWEKYASTREAIPKTAFSFGVKAGDGRKKEPRGKAEKQKLYQAMYHSVSGALGTRQEKRE